VIFKHEKEKRNKEKRSALFCAYTEKQSLPSKNIQEKFATLTKIFKFLSFWLKRVNFIPKS